jgi:hypothetical protein
MPRFVAHETKDHNLFRGHEPGRTLFGNDLNYISENQIITI